MHIEINGARLFFEVVGAKLAYGGPDVCEKPSLIALHGGPGFDHMTLRPFFDRFADVAQVIYLDHRGNGRSGGNDPATWTLAQWGEDVRAFAEALGIVKPIVVGHSFGGMVAQAYATAHPEHAAALILSSTTARFDYADRLRRFEAAGGAEARQAAERFFAIGDQAASEEYGRLVLPLYVTYRGPADADAARRTIRRVEVARHFFRTPGGEIHSMDFRSDLSCLRVPVLVISGGEGDLITPPEDSETIARSLPPELMRIERFPQARHGAFRDAPGAVEAVLRAFIAEAAARAA